MTAATKPRFARSAAIAVAKELCDALRPVTWQLIVAGSLRRRTATVGDVEILFVPRFDSRPADLFSVRKVDLVAELLDGLVATGKLAKRASKTGAFAWGEKNKLATYTATGIPVDLFTATAENWWSYLVCRTGSAANNLRLATRAQERGWKWNPYGPGFTRLRSAEIHPVASEREVFEFLDLPYLEPWER